MSIQYTVPGFEPTTFRTWVSSHNHQTRAPAPYLAMFTIRRGKWGSPFGYVTTHTQLASQLAKARLCLSVFNFTFFSVSLRQHFVRPLCATDLRTTQALGLLKVVKGKGCKKSGTNRPGSSAERKKEDIKERETLETDRQSKISAKLDRLRNVRL